MKKEEKIVETYFKSIGYKNIVFEPKGNRTPDFEIDGEIAIEVRRLNQLHRGKPLEKTRFKLLPKIIHQIESYENNNHLKSAFVGIRYLRPINFSKRLRSEINSILQNHSSIIEYSREYRVNNNLELSIFPSPERLDVMYHFGYSVDLNEGGMVLENIHQSLKAIISEKSEKIKKYKDEYKFWWLALVDNIGGGLSDSELSKLKDKIDFDLKFDKIFIISNINPLKGSSI